MLLFMDGFDHYNDTTELIRKGWSSQASNTFVSTTRFGTGQSCSVADYLYKQFADNYETIIVGFAFYFNVGFPGNFLLIQDTTTTQAYLTADPTSGILKLYTGGVLRETYGTSLAHSTWYFLEFKLKVNNTTGSYEVKLNGTTIFSDTGVDTQSSANAYANRITIDETQGFRSVYVDDFYVLDTSGTVNNDFIGDCRIETLYPDGAGNYSQWSPTGAGSNYLCVDDNFPDDDSTYVSVSGTGLKDSYTMDDLVTAVGTIYGVQSSIYARKDDAGTIGVQPLFRISSTDYTVSGETLGDSYNYLTNIREVSPATATAWAVSEVNGLEFGFNKDV